MKLYAVLTALLRTTSELSDCGESRVVPCCLACRQHNDMARVSSCSSRSSSSRSNRSLEVLVRISASMADLPLFHTSFTVCHFSFISLPALDCMTYFTTSRKSFLSRTADRQSRYALRGPLRDFSCLLVCIFRILGYFLFWFRAICQFLSVLYVSLCRRAYIISQKGHWYSPRF